MIDYQRIAARRKQIGLSQAELAARVNVSVKTISFIENGHSENLGIIRLICDVLQLPYSEIVRAGDNAVGEQSAEYYDAARRRWALYYERIPPPLVDRFCELVEAALKLLE
jgi:transcriptional regulator with XRE-family HTH domain